MIGYLYNQSKTDEVEQVKKKEQGKEKTKSADQPRFGLHEAAGLLSLKPRPLQTLRTRFAADIRNSKLW
jgi:hypothetical protein